MKGNKRVPSPFGVTMGDPAGIGAEVSLKAIASLPKNLKRRVVLIGEKKYADEGAKLAKIGKPPFVDFDPESLPPIDKIAFIDLPQKGRANIKPGKISASSGKSALSYIEKGAELSLNKTLSGIVTAPIDKRALALAKVKEPGHTEILFRLSKVKDGAMMLASPSVKVVLLSIHCPLRKAVSFVKKRLILNKLMLMNRCLELTLPIAVCGFNPHASDAGRFGNEEEREIIPAIKEAKRMGINADGPFAADSLFAPENRKKYGAILAMYHDQGLVGIKAISFGNCANITLGLPFIRTSVDHGTALDIAGKGIANPASMIFAIKTAFKMAKK